MEGRYQHFNTQNPLYSKRTPLPPIICERDKATLREVQDYIKTELQKAKCVAPGPDNRRFSIYSTAFSMLVSKVTVYKDILSDIKREYEDCISTLKNGEREAKFLQVKVKTMSSIPTTYNGYMRRQEELEERLGILNAENSRLEDILNELIKSQEVKTSENGDENEDENAPKPERFENRPIPGLPVSDWINEKALKSTLKKLDGVIAELRKQLKTSYVPAEEQKEALQEFKEKVEEKERLSEECQKLKNRHKILKMANEAAREYKELRHYRSGESLSDFILKRVTEYSIKRETSNLVDSPHTGFEDDDPSREKEAEMILEYIESFNELFFDKEYADAATHAAISPRGVLRDMETLLRFKEASKDYVGTPTPLLMFAEAFMYSSPSQMHYADEHISYECVNCALMERRHDMALHWVAQGYIKSCKAVADLLSQYSTFDRPHHPCLATAQMMYAETEGCKVLAASLLYKLKQPTRMLHFTYTEKFSKAMFFELIKEHMDDNLVWILSRATSTEYAFAKDNDHYSDYESALPIPLSQSLVFLLKEGEEGSKTAVNLLKHVYEGRKSENLKSEHEEDKLFVASDLSKIIYNEGGEDPFDTEELIKQRWKTLETECQNRGEPEVATDIQATLIIRRTIAKALSFIAEDEKEQFDYYT